MSHSSVGDDEIYLDWVARAVFVSNLWNFKSFSPKLKLTKKLLIGLSKKQKNCTNKMTIYFMFISQKKKCESIRWIN